MGIPPPSPVGLRTKLLFNCSWNFDFGPLAVSVWSTPAVLLVNKGLRIRAYHHPSLVSLRIDEVTLRYYCGSWSFGFGPLGALVGFTGCLGVFHSDRLTS